MKNTCKPRKIKIDYNETIGAGCDGAESLGEGLRKNMEASKAFVQEIKKEIPVIAAQLHHVIHPTQSQIWAVIHEDDKSVAILIK